ncbi:MAG: hypothetical protein IJX04_06975 [Oscillospiraceae bacterium]|nr:hypothetical protein [Oscillospiraceae bacterium]
MVPVKTDGGFWLVLGLMVLLFPLRFLLGVLLAAFVHELGHLLAVRLTGGRVLGIRLHACGARIEAAPMEPGQAAVCALAGPAAGAVCILAWRWFPELALAALVQTGFNLIPIYPLDGGRAVRNICCKLRNFGVQ